VHDGIDLTDKSDVYVEARFDAAVSLHESNAVAEQRKAATPKADGSGQTDPRADAINSIRGAYKRNK